MSSEEPEGGCANILVWFTEAVLKRAASVKKATKKGAGEGGTRSAKAEWMCKRQGWKWRLGLTCVRVHTVQASEFEVIHLKYNTDHYVLPSMLYGLMFSGNISDQRDMLLWKVDRPDIQVLSVVGLTSPDICCSHHMSEAIKALYVQICQLV